MANIDVIKLAEFFEKSSIAKLSYSVDNEKIVLEKYTQTAPAIVSAPAVQTINTNVVSEMSTPAVANSNENTEMVKAPLVGVFYAAKAPGEAPFVSVGDRIEKGQILCLIEAMKMMSEITAPVSGVVKSVKFKNEDVVAFDDVLFEILV